MSQHGNDCPKVKHVTGGYEHHESDDSPYDVDGVMYCGRCHAWMGTDAQTVREVPRPAAWTLAACRERAGEDVPEKCGYYSVFNEWARARNARDDRAQLLALVSRLADLMCDAAPDLRKAVHEHAAEMYRLVGASSDNCKRCERLAALVVRMEALGREVDATWRRDDDAR